LPDAKLTSRACKRAGLNHAHKRVHSSKPVHPYSSLE
jgi:hypothetical protein